MDESDLEAEHAAARRLVDQLGARVGEMRKGSADVVHLVRDVMHPRASLGEETADRRVVSERAEQLEAALADPDRRGLHTLLLDPRAMLEPGAEKPLVRVERAVEILDRETDMVHRGGCVHAAMVFERLAATMRAPLPVLVVVLAGVLLAGCGGSNKAKANGEASKPAGRVLADADAAAKSASSVHVSGNINSTGTKVVLDLSLTSNKGATGSVTTDGLKFDLIRVGDTLYVRGSDAFYAHFAGAPAAKLLHGKWLKGSATASRLTSLVPLTDMGPLFDKISAGHGKVVNDGTKTYKGQQVVQIRDTTDGSKLLVAGTGKPYPVAITGGSKSQSGAITFDDWNKGVPLSAPAGAIDISRIGG